MTERRRLIVTCEHASRRVPARYRPLFAGHRQRLAGHHGYDPGSLALARRLATLLEVPLFTGSWTRLLVDLNRSVGHRGLFSDITRELSQPERERIIAGYYRPYRAAVERALAESLRHNRRVLHVSVHSFTPVLNGATRNADIGLLYNPARPAERALAGQWKRALTSRLALRIRCNYPYRGTADGFTTWLRKRFPDPAYAGIELELNQRLLPLSAPLVMSVAATLGECLQRSRAARR